MPLEIRELIIKVNIEKEIPDKREYVMDDISNLKQDIIRECTDTIFSRINSTTER